MKKSYILLLFITFLNNLTSMQVQDEKKKTILALPNEMLDCIIKQVLKQDFLEALNNWNDIFEESPKPDLSLTKNLGETCRQFHSLCKDNLILNENLRLFNNLKEERFEQLFASLRHTALEKYEGISPEKLNDNLIKLLKNILHYENSKEELKEVVKLIFAGADVNAKFDLNYTALMLAVEGGCKEIVEMLIKLEADVNFQNNYGENALRGAVLACHKKIAKILIKAGAEINSKHNLEYTALNWAVINDCKDMVKMLLNKGANAQGDDGKIALILAVKGDHKEILEMLLNKGADVNAQDGNGVTALMWAVINGYQDTIEMINTDRNIGLMYATISDHIDILEMLLNAGADVNIQNNNGDTALMYAAERGYKKIVKMLLNAGADVNIQNNNEDTALMLANRNGHSDIAEILERDYYR